MRKYQTDEGSLLQEYIKRGLYFLQISYFIILIKKETKGSITESKVRRESEETLPSTMAVMLNRHRLYKPATLTKIHQFQISNQD